MNGFQSLTSISAQSQVETTTQKRKEFFVVLTTKALPLLLTVMEPLNMFNCLSLVHFRLAHIKRLLPPVFDYSNQTNMAMYFATTEKLLATQDSQDAAFGQLFAHSPPTRRLQMRLKEFYMIH